MHEHESSARRPSNRAERRGKAGKAAAPAPGRGTGHGKVHGTKFAGPAPRQFQNRKHG